MLGSFWGHVGSFWGHVGPSLGSCWGYFGVHVGVILQTVFADSVKLQKCNPSQAKLLFWGVLGLHFGIILGIQICLVFMLRSGLHFFPTWGDFGLQMGSRLGSI